MVGVGANSNCRGESVHKGLAREAAKPLRRREEAGGLPF